jgi:hypothetical protein
MSFAPLDIKPQCHVCNYEFSGDDLITRIDFKIYCQTCRPDKPKSGTDPLYKPSDPLNPSHYHHGGLDVFTIMDKNMPHMLEGFYFGNVLKYIMRYEHKNGVEDLRKARRYLDELIAIKTKDLD